MTTITTIDEITDFTNFVQSHFLGCPNHPDQWESTKIDLLKSNFCRYTKRTMYYAKNFVENVEKAKNDIRTRPRLLEGKIMVSIADDCFFDFDAFVFSCRSILDKRFVTLATHLNPQVKGQFLKFAKIVNDTFIKSLLKPIRDEVVHLNNYGLAIGSIAHVEDDKISIKAFNNNADLENLFNIILFQMYDITRKIGISILEHECLTFGYPEKEIGYQGRTKLFKLSDYIKIPD